MVIIVSRPPPSELRRRARLDVCLGQVWGFEMAACRIRIDLAPSFTTKKEHRSRLLDVCLGQALGALATAVAFQLEALAPPS